MLGKVIKERYCILEQIGGGGNGKVYLAKDLELGCHWAVKKIALSQRKEAMLLKKLDHPFLPKMIDYVETEKECFLIMEYIQGENLETWLNKKEKVTQKETIEILLKIAKLLRYFHEQNPPVFYSDLKPANLICTQSGEIYLVDFGSAVLGYRKEGICCQGTKGYAAPEMFRGKISEVSDIYAFGKTMGCFLKRRKNMSGRWLSLFWIAFRCCRKKEKFRYQKIEQLIRKLERIEQRGKNRGWILLLCIMFLCFWLKNINFNGDEIKKFEEALTEATEIYWRQENSILTKKSCEKAEEKLKEMLRDYSESEEQRKILLLLAVNAEYMEAYENALFYYEQMLMYEDAYMEGYAAYGLFLLRQGREEESAQLYEIYQEKEKDGKIEEEKDSKFMLWLERLDASGNKSD